MIASWHHYRVGESVTTEWDRGVVVELVHRYSDQPHYLVLFRCSPKPHLCAEWELTAARPRVIVPVENISKKCVE